METKKLTKSDFTNNLAIVKTAKEYETTYHVEGNEYKIVTGRLLFNEIYYLFNGEARRIYCVRFGESLDNYLNAPVADKIKRWYYAERGQKIN
jgi:hypothetical protein